MTPATEKVQPTSQFNKLVKRLILIVILLVSVLLIALGVRAALLPQFTLAQISDTPTLGSLLSNPSFTPTTRSTATATSTATVQPTASSTATATATNTSKPTATQTLTPSVTPGAMIKVLGNSTILRSGPGNNYAAVRTLKNGEQVALIGRTSNKVWFYVQTSDGQDGWVISVLVDLTGVKVDTYFVATPPPIPEATVMASADGVALRTGPGSDYVQIRRLSYIEPLTLLGRSDNNDWLYVKASDGQEGWVATNAVLLGRVNFNTDYYPVQTAGPTETSTPTILEGVTGRWIDIDLSEQKLRAYEGTTLVASFLVSTGIPEYPTEKGLYKIYAKFRYIDMHGADYFLPDVPWNMFYSGDFSIHGTYWHHNFGTPFSHGCVNMDIPDAEWVYNWADIGTPVNIHR